MQTTETTQKPRRKMPNVVGIVVSDELRDTIQKLALLEQRSVSNIGLILLKKGLEIHKPNITMNNN